jgi:type I restriction enzyme, R subunit
LKEAETRAELIDPALLAAGWGSVESTKVFREYKITAGRIQSGGKRDKPLSADYVLSYKGLKLAVIEAKSEDVGYAEGVAQAKDYATRLRLDYTYAADGHSIYQIDMKTGKEGLVSAFPSPQKLWARVMCSENVWRETFAVVPFEDQGGSKEARYYQELAINKTMEAIASGRKRMLLTLATGTGKTFIAFQIVWKLFKTKWNTKSPSARLPRVLFLADRNILADQAFNDFSAFPEDALARIRPDEIRKKGKVPTNGSIFFTIFQTFMCGADADGKPAPYFGEYPPDYFDFIIIDECHRGGANDESAWRGILEYFAPAFQLGLTATPRRRDNADTYLYFGEPVFVYSLKEGINDGFLTPFRVKRVRTTMDSYVYVSDDTIVEGEVEEGRLYDEEDFNRIIEIKEREAERVRIFMNQADQSEKSIVFCATQTHAAAVRDLVNQMKKNSHPDYCVRVTANDGERGEQLLRDFQDNEKTIPTVLTTSQKLSTGVNALNIRNIVLMRPINSIIEFKQIIGRGTRVFEGKSYFTIYDFVGASDHFADQEWDGDPIPPEPCKKCGNYPCTCDKPIIDPGLCRLCGQDPCVCVIEDPEPCEICGRSPCICGMKKKLKIKLADGKERTIQHMVATSFWSPDGRPISAAEFIRALYGALPGFFSNEDELRRMWADPSTRKALLDKLSDSGFGRGQLVDLQKLIDAENSDLFDVLEYVAFSVPPISREDRVALAKPSILDGVEPRQREFVEFVLAKYVESGVEELDREKLPGLLELKYQALTDAAEILGGPDAIAKTFLGFQKRLYAKGGEDNRAA